MVLLLNIGGFMRLLIINSFGQSESKDSDCVPSIGDSVDMFYSPLPIVTSVVWWPSLDRLQALGITIHYDAIITVK